jgi:hypothetical protein
MMILVETEGGRPGNGEYIEITARREVTFTSSLLDDDTPLIEPAGLILFHMTMHP